MSEDIWNQPLDYFKHGEVSDTKIAYYVSRLKQLTPDILFDDKDVPTLSKDTDQVISFRARFLLKNGPLNLDADRFTEARTFDQINRKTQFSKVRDGVF